MGKKRSRKKKKKKKSPACAIGDFQLPGKAGWVKKCVCVWVWVWVLCTLLVFPVGIRIAFGPFRVSAKGRDNVILIASSLVAAFFLLPVHATYSIPVGSSILPSFAVV
ncbi:uncharacterized protein BO80DRAFT_91419 [Aspergillus ibericus CBS 121593]|uniref:Transmembrane protein n=1 Tax=Aspergillus ibericus CBS 121593 TaxID=1448316 RepID=A0A395H0T2_9EURO|nr:hypothetical protein BO80DRAFT_91419 [Aspergillus ibericus CBS 121593]RAL00959.1 hypothetical protein BO80DRAFT_91419 [Aspergillus ibericus CBS 121593]